MRRRTPQEKKVLSYLKDRRNLYGENDKSSRKNIPRAKRARHHALRRGEQLALERLKATGGALDESETRFERRLTGQWRKAADDTLAEAVVLGLQQRVRRGGTDSGRAAERITRIRRRLGLTSD